MEKTPPTKKDLLVTSKLAAFWLEAAMKSIAENPTDDPELNNEMEEYLGTAAGALLRWRLHTGVSAGLIHIDSVEAWEEDEFD